MSNDAQPRSAAVRGALRAVLVGALVVGAGFHLMLAAGAGSMVADDGDIASAVALQAVVVTVAGAGLLRAAYRVIRSRPVARLVVAWALPAFLFHLVIVFLDPNESTFFPLVTGIAPAVAGLSVLWQRTKSRRTPAHVR